MKTRAGAGSSADNSAEATRNAVLFAVSLALGVSAVGGAAVAVYFSRKGDGSQPATAAGSGGKAKLATAVSMTSIAVDSGGGTRFGGAGKDEHQSAIYRAPNL